MFFQDGRVDWGVEAAGLWFALLDLLRDCAGLLLLAALIAAVATGDLLRERGRLRPTRRAQGVAQRWAYTALLLIPCLHAALVILDPPLTIFGGTLCVGALTVPAYLSTAVWLRQRRPYQPLIGQGGGTARIWGGNSGSQFGDGITTQRLTPVAVSGLTTATAVAAGANHSLALLADGTVRVWGANSYGQLGDDTTTQRNTPIAVSGLQAVDTDHGTVHLRRGRDARHAPHRRGDLVLPRWRLVGGVYRHQRERAGRVARADAVHPPRAHNRPAREYAWCGVRPVWVIISGAGASSRTPTAKSSVARTPPRGAQRGGDIAQRERVVSPASDTTIYLSGDLCWLKMHLRLQWLVCPRGLALRHSSVRVV